MSRNSGKKMRNLGFVALTVFAINCGDPIPVQEMSDAKVAIGRAETVKADRYASEKYEGARKALFESHDFVSKDKMEDATKKAIESKKLADESYDIAAPLLAQDTKKEAEAAIQAADEANAEEFAADDFKAAKDALADGNTKYDSKAYLDSFHAYETSREKARAAQNTSEARAEGMWREVNDIEDMIKKAEMAGAQETAPDTLRAAKEKVAFAKQNLNQKKLKAANAEIAAARESAKQALSVAQKEWANRKLAEAKQAVAAAETRHAELKQKLEDPATKKATENSTEVAEAVKLADDNMTAAKEALRAAEEANRNSSYQDSYNQSEEAIRLSKIVGDAIPETEVLIASAKDRSVTEKTDTESTDSSEDTESGEDATAEDSEDAKGWKKYKVRLIPENRDCLWKISGYKFHYGNPRLWPAIYRANKAKIKNPDLIYPGQVFKIPPKSLAVKDKKPPKGWGKKSKGKKGKKTVKNADTAEETGDRKSVV